MYLGISLELLRTVWGSFSDSYLIQLLLLKIYKPLPMFSSVQFSHSVMSNSLRPHGLQHTRPHCPSSSPGAHSNSCQLNQ